MLNAWMDIYNAMRVTVVRLSPEKSVLQITLHNGILFFELEGRPDGLKPQQAKSYFELYNTQLRQSQQRHLPYELPEEASAKVFQELLLYYARCMALLKLSDQQQAAQKDAVQILRIVHFLKHNSRADLLAEVKTFEAFFNQLYAYAFSGSEPFAEQKSMQELALFISKKAAEYFQKTAAPKTREMVFTTFEEN
jgi:hypothetical protein